MFNPLNNLKLWALVDFINSVEAPAIVDLLENFAKKYFGDKWKESLKALQFKLANVVVEIQRRIK
jgi:hypothetical protein